MKRQQFILRVEYDGGHGRTLEFETVAAAAHDFAAFRSMGSVKVATLSVVVTDTKELRHLGELELAKWTREEGLQ